MQKSPVFKQCATCRAMISVSDRHKSYLICLGEEFVRGKFPICTSFPMRTKKQRNFCFKVHLLEKVMSPSSELDPDHKRTDSLSARNGPLAALVSKPKLSKKHYSYSDSLFEAAKIIFILWDWQTIKVSTENLNSLLVPSRGLVAGTDTHQHRWLRL